MNAQAINTLIRYNFWANGRLLREYTVLLDPPLYDPTPAPAVAPAPVEVTPPSPLLWQPGPEMSGLMRPSSQGPHEVKPVTVSLLEFKAPTVMWFLAQAGGGVVP